MIPQNHDPLKEALAGDRLISQDIIFGKIAIWGLKLATVGTTGVFTWSLLSNSLPKEASTLMIGFAGLGAFMLEVCFLLATIWIKISRNGIQTALAWSIFGFSLFFLLVNVVAGAILSESKQATLGKGWIDLYLVIMPATGVICAVLVVLWSLASPEASTARRNSIASGLVSQRYEAARLRTALHDVSLNEVVDQAASRDAWNAVSRNLGLPAPQQGMLPALPAATATNMPGIPNANANSNPYEQAYYLHNMHLVPTSPPAVATAAPAQQQRSAAAAPVATAPVPTTRARFGQARAAAPAVRVKSAKQRSAAPPAATAPAPTVTQSQSAKQAAPAPTGWLELPIVKQIISAYSDKDKDKDRDKDSKPVEPSNPQPDPTSSSSSSNSGTDHSKN